MDFGEILDNWDAMKKTGGKAQGAAGAPPEGEARSTEVRNVEARRAEARRAVDPLTAWLRINGVIDKDALGEAGGESPADRRRRLKEKRPDAVVDLHGLTRDEAWDRLQSFVAEAHRGGAEKILVIHGKGNHSEGEAILKRTAKDFLERCPLTGEQGTAPAVHGGAGATWALLKRKGKS